ncbi:MAG TPA: phosphoenolpyruvate carboxykinase (ATP) [Chitinophagales bacterium]|nr:phosphoenolpyruvate carboxykinase (ATP) [Chitinophagales bacterium]MBP6153824.1 phosphoenolpyruvate carboxykinase (ATP) [Chitinophagales bacterium]HQV77723.1 phosphoenolpyruvate carboxykinase (ATP) [Chitinophagales bacterium]HQW78196.1 phosphoenolpyruvate carboxykinase (ATP) [Chitinophagales bacterium]HRB66901.1 phosphoenolpyruvate carboxykinase (ATP) [Chitinophagales bacterium]
MSETAEKHLNQDLSKLGFQHSKINWNISREDLIQKTLDLNLGVLSSAGALCINTGEFTGRSPKDKFTVKDALTENAVDWNAINQPFSPEAFDALQAKVIAHLDKNSEIYVRDVAACADEKYKVNVRVITETPWASLFADNMFLRSTQEDIANFLPDWTILCAPSCVAIKEEDGTRQHNFSIINFTKKVILIGGSSYTGEIKKGIFTVLNFELPHLKNVLSMHCSANIGNDGDTALFFGLSGTGKTTLSADPNRKLIGDDEHGWSDNGVFNFEGGCYAKCVDLTEEKEPDIFRAIKPGAILENIGFFEGTNEVNFEDVKITENTRVSYPLYHINNIAVPSVGSTPKNIFFLSYDAFGVLPPISKLTEEQAMYLFISGYTSKVAGTEAGVTEPQTTFSACFGAAFLPLHPTKYAEMLGKKLKESGANVWLVNTGMTGGVYGVGKRMSLKYTRALITSALNGELANATYETLPIFNFQIPTVVDGVPSEILNPRNAWADQVAYDAKATELAGKFNENFKKYADKASTEILAAAPQV